MKNLHVLHIIDHMGLGGAQRAVCDQIKHRSYDFAFIINGAKSHVLDEIAKEKILYNGAVNFLEYFKVYSRLLKLVESSSFDIIHCHLRWSWLLGLLISLRPSNKSKLLFHERGSILSDGIFYYLLAHLCSQKGSIVAVSKNTATALAKNGISQNSLTVIYNGLDTDTFQPNIKKGSALRTTLGISKKNIAVGFAGRFEKFKGWQDFIQAIQIASLENNQILGVISGGGPDEQNLMSLIKKLGVENKIKLIGYTNNMEGFYNALDFLVFPSHFEPLGRVQLEAQSCGIPVIATRIDGITEVISEENSILVEKGKPEEIAKAVLFLINNPEIKKRLVLAGIENSQKFNLNIYLKNINSFYTKLSNTEN